VLKIFLTIELDDSLKVGKFTVKGKNLTLKKGEGKMKAAQQEPKKHYRVLFVNDTQESKEAVRLLESHSFFFSHTPVDPNSEEFTPDRLPFLITDEGQWQGLGAIERYIHNSIALGEPL